jgi:hypothetical protein
MRRSWIIWNGLLAGLALGCSTAAPIDVNVDDEGKEDSAKRVALSAGQDTTIRFKSTGGASTVTVNCSPSSNPDDRGLTFSVDAPTLGTKSSDPDRAGYFRTTAVLDAGTHEMTLVGQSGKGSCSVSVQKTSASCQSSLVYHSPNTNHTHFRVGTDTSSDWEKFPASGNHWGAWAAWGQVYQRPIKRGFLLHNLEHGGIVLSYNCSASNQSAECKAAYDTLVQLKNEFGENRVIVTPDPTQPTLYGIRAWRWAYLSDCVDMTKMLQFMDQHIKHGREDIDADPPIPFDPTTTHVPCQDLMAAPDSCS